MLVVQNDLGLINAEKGLVGVGRVSYVDGRSNCL